MGRRFIVRRAAARHELASAQIAPSSHFAALDGIRVHYTNYGTGEKALLLVHGWSSDETVWKQQAPELAKSIRVITADLPGHGPSDKPEREYTMDFYAQALDAVLRDAGVKKATSSGTATAPSSSGSFTAFIHRR
ncbi:MAG: alpha/beta fold hydrolase [Chthoniobacterales bacterium]